jgi:acyl-ACP thioesterase
LIIDEAGRTIGRAKGLWVFFDIEKRKPLPIFNDIKEKWKSHKEDSISHNIRKKIPAIAHDDAKLEFKVNRFDTDMNKHVNNIRYLQWVMESIPEDVLENYQLESIDGRFIAEAQYGETVKTFIDQQSQELAFHHTIRSGTDNRICATAHTTWKKAS